MSSTFLEKMMFGFGYHYDNGEAGYISLLDLVLMKGQVKQDRTGIGTRSVHAITITYDCSEGYPLFQSKTVPFKSVVAELLWFLEGSNSDERLSELTHGISGKKTIWTANIEAKEKPGPIYGVQWRDFARSTDQIKYIENELKTNPNSRRMVVSAWAPQDIPEMCLPPCHVLWQLLTCEDESGERTLNMLVYMRSNDLGLGHPFNVASYALLLNMFAYTHDYKVGKLHFTLGDAHVYENHVEQLRFQINRQKDQQLQIMPRLVIKTKKSSILDYTMEDFKIFGYKPLGPIKMEMAV